MFKALLGRASTGFKTSIQLNRRISLLRPQASHIRQFHIHHSNRVHWPPTPPRWPPRWSKPQWPQIRSGKFTVDELSAYISWLLMGNVMLILLATTTSIGILLYLTDAYDSNLKSKIFERVLFLDNNLTVDFSHPKFSIIWENGKIKIKNVKIKSSDTDFLIYNLKFDQINLTLSLSKWLHGKGLINDVDINGMEGDVYINNSATMELEAEMDNSLHENYEFGNFKITHSKLNFQNENLLQHPLELCLFNCELDRIRRDWIVYDFLDANTMFGSLGGSLFTLHRRQRQLNNFTNVDGKEKAKLWNKISRLRIDTLDLSFLNSPNGKFNFIESGQAEVVFDIMFPDDDLVLNDRKLTLREYAESFKDLIFNFKDKDYSQDKIKAKDKAKFNDENKYVVIDTKITFESILAQNSNTPVSSLTNEAYISSNDLQDLVLFLNDENLTLKKFNEDYYDSEIDVDELEDLEFEHAENENILPPLKFRIVQNLNDFKYLDLVGLLTCGGSYQFSYSDQFQLKQAQFEEGKFKNERIYKSWKHTNEFIDLAVIEIFTLLNVYKNEMRGRIIEKWSGRSGLDILLGEVVLGNLILVGLGTFVI
ncbi:hypothetical protein DAMA08_047590 [Martiniozyma asiatica (nom. inval.)]|nr:hypothetical protein DAMA08_047590 [Martiniozyma asiatica]